MQNKSLSTQLSSKADKSLSGWDRAIAEAKKRIREIKRSITRFESLRDQGMKFPAPKKKQKPSRSRLARD